MLHPSYYELMEKINRESEMEDPILTSRYSLVLATSKRARQLVDGSMPRVKASDDKNNLTVAVEELYQGLVTILPGQEEEAQEEESLTEAPEAAAEEESEAAEAAQEPELIV